MVIGTHMIQSLIKTPFFFGYYLFLYLLLEDGYFLEKLNFLSYDFIDLKIEYIFTL